MSGETWRARLPCTRAEAEAIPFGDDDPGEDPPTLLTDEPDPARPDDWVLDAYFSREPDAAAVARIAALVPSAPEGSARVERLDNADWVTLSQAGLEPVRAGRFLVHTRAHARARRPGDLAIRIEAGLAFGTGQHFTTHGCLTALDALAKRHRFSDALDLGTGSGVLAMAIVRRWPTARIIASDIDPVATRVAAGNLTTNGIRRGRAAGLVELVTATGMNHQRLRRRAPYQLITANILAAPLIALAQPVAGALATGGALILAGLLTHQVRAVTAAYAMRGCRLVARHDFGEWPTLVLRKARA